MGVYENKNNYICVVNNEILDNKIILKSIRNTKKNELNYILKIIHIFKIIITAKRNSSL